MPLDLDVRDRGWAEVEVEAPADGVAALIWSPADGSGSHRRKFAVRKGRHAYPLMMADMPGWSRLAALGRHPGPDQSLRLVAIAIRAEPAAPPALQVDYLGLADALPRPGTPFRILAAIRNTGGQTSTVASARLRLPAGLRFAAEPPAGEAAVPTLEPDETAEIRWTVAADRPGEYPLELCLADPATPATASVRVEARPPVPPAADGVPTPRPVPTDVEICAYYFPGWNRNTKWDCTRRLAPIRKPLLGFYDEGRPECMDWQIKWAVENGISTFLVDWHWEAGVRRYEHWFEAYRRARHRDRLKVAIMWANHNAHGTHSADDWRAATRHWIERYFPLPAYQRLNGKPALYL